MPDESRIRRPKRVATLRLAPPYDVYTVRAWINVPESRFEELRASPTTEVVARFVADVIVEHDLTDFDGAPLPPAGSLDLAKVLDGDIYSAIMQARQAEVGRLDPPSAKS